MELLEFKDLVESPINKLMNVVGDELKQVAKNRLLEYQTNEYKRNFYTKTLLHRSEPVRLTDFYLPLHITPYKKERRPKSEQKRISTEDITKLFSKTNYITLIGNAGSGKSTIIKYLFINSVKLGFKIPIKVELRYLNDYKGSLTDYIYDEIFLFHKLGFSKEIIERVLSSDSFVFFFDGYDEVNSAKKESITKEIDKFVSRYSNNFYLLTSRPYTNIDTLPLFTNYVVCDLLSSEIPPFVKKQIQDSEEELAEKIIKAVTQIEKSSYRTFLSNPLLLSMFILTFQSYSEIPQKRSDFYKQVFDTLYSVHDSVSKLSYVREKQSGLSKEGFEQILRLFSFISYFEEKFLFQSEYLNNKLNLIKKKKKDLKFDNESLIEDLQIAIGILNKEGIDYTFPHRSLQEYFASNYISSLSESNRETILNKIRVKIQKQWFYIIDNHHFLSLLTEQNYNSVVRHLAIPLLEEQFQKISDKNSLSLEVKYDVQCKVFLVAIHLMQPSINELSIHVDYCKKHRPKIVLISSNSRDFLLPDIKEERKVIDENEINQSIDLFIKKGNKWISEIKTLIEDQEKSDTEIIDII